MNRLMCLLSESLWIPWCRRSRPRAFENDDDGARVYSRIHCRWTDWWSDGGDVGGGRIDVWWGNVTAHVKGWDDRQ